MKHITSITAASILVATSSAMAANVRVAHLSPDAPAVDVLVNGKAAFTNLSFGEFTEYADLPAGDYQIQVVAAGTDGPAVIDTEVALPADGDFSIAAIDTLENITAAIFEDENLRIPGTTRVRFVHASPGTPAVDIAVTGGPILFPNVSFGESGGYIEVPGGTYDLEARVANTDIVALSLPGVELSGGSGVSIWASGFLNAEPALGVAVSVDVEPKAKLRVIHASPDAPSVDVKLNGTRAITELAFNESTDYAMIDAGEYNVKVVPAGLDDPVVIDADLDLMAMDYTVVASDVLSSITPIVLVDDNALDVLARIRFVHASPNAPAVDIALADGGPVLFADVEFGENAGYVEVPGGTYDLEARVAGTNTVALSVPGFKVTGFRNFTVLATGLLGGDPALGVIATLDSEKCATDIVGDGLTGVNDILALLDSFGTTDSFADIDNSGIVDVDDAMQLIMNYGRCN